MKLGCFKSESRAAARQRWRNSSTAEFVKESTFCLQDVQKVFVEPLNLLEATGIGPKEVLPHDREHDIAASVERIDTGHFT